MIGTSRAELVFIRVSVFFFRYTPVLYSLLLILFYMLGGDSPWSFIMITVLSVSLTAEALFYLLVWWPFQSRLRNKAIFPAPSSSIERRKLFTRCTENISSIELYLQGWFLGAALEDIRRDNLREFLMWAFFELDETDFGQWDESDEQDLEFFIHRIEELLGKAIKPGRSPVKSLRLNYDEIYTSYRSLAWYIVIFFVDQITHMVLWCHGFQYFTSSSNHEVFPPRPQSLLASHRSNAPCISYWYYPRQHIDDSNLPLLFFHGIGVGLWTYTRFLSGLRNSHRAGIIAVETLAISFRLTSPPLDRVEFLRQIHLILDHHNWERFAIVSHSYGSVQASQILRSTTLQSRVSAIAMIDPVSIMLHMPPVAYNFTRRAPSRANEWQLWYFASTDPGVAHCLGRHFFWRENIIWKDEIVSKKNPDGTGAGARRAAVFLSGQDVIVDAPSVARYLEGGTPGLTDPGTDASVKVTLFPDLDHAQVFDDHAICDHVTNLVIECCQALD